jgi:hypothetical protein
MSALPKHEDDPATTPESNEVVVETFYREFTDYMATHGLPIGDVDPGDHAFMKDLTLDFLDEKITDTNVGRSEKGLPPVWNIAGRARVKSHEFDRQLAEKSGTTKDDIVREAFREARPLLTVDGSKYRDIILLNGLAALVKARGNRHAIEALYELYASYGMALDEVRRIGRTSTQPAASATEEHEA